MLRDTGVTDDEQVRATAQQLLELADPRGSAAGKYVIDATGATIGVIGDGATQTNYFVTVGIWAEKFWTESLAETPSPAEQFADRSLSTLLVARHQVVPFIGRTAERDELARWRDGTRAVRAVRLVCGPGGMGTTRLAMQFAADSLAAGWMVMVAHHVGEPEPAAKSAVAGGRQGILLLVDYSERWPRDDLLTLMRDVVQQQQHPIDESGTSPVRVLLVARSGDWWWSSMANPLDKLGFVVDDQLLTAATPFDRERMFTTARDRFAELLMAPDPQRLPPAGLLTEPAYGSPLTVQMAALVTVTARADGVPARPDELSQRLLAREYDHWQTLYDNGRTTTPPRQMARVVAVAALTGTVDYQTAAALLIRAGFSDGDTDRLLDDHRLCYPPTQSGTALAPLLPDRLAEDFLADRLDTGGAPWCRRLVSRLVLTAAVEATPQARHALTVVVETGYRAPSVRTDVLEPLLREHPDTVVAIGGPVLARLAGIPSLAPVVLESVAAAMPQVRRVDLDAAAAALSTVLLSHHRAHRPVRTRSESLSYKNKTHQPAEEIFTYQAA